jgi:hypothetical protein
MSFVGYKFYLKLVEINHKVVLIVVAPSFLFWLGETLNLVSIIS